MKDKDPRVEDTQYGAPLATAGSNEHVPTADASVLADDLLFFYVHWHGIATPIDKARRDLLMKAAHQIRALRDEVAQWRTWGVIEIAVRNPNVSQLYGALGRARTESRSRTRTAQPTAVAWAGWLSASWCSWR
jgi:hypothetical protein